MRDRGKKLLNALRSPIGRKIVTGITGLGLTLFVLGHMSGNLSYFSSDPQAYNKYAHFLTGLGFLFYAIEIGLLAFFIILAQRPLRALPSSPPAGGGGGLPAVNSH